MANLDKSSGKTGIKWLDDMPPLNIQQMEVMSRLEKKVIELQKDGVYIEPYQVRNHLIRQKVVRHMPYKTDRDESIAYIRAQKLIHEEYPIYNASGEIKKQQISFDHHLFDGMPEDINKKAFAKEIYNK
jgi:hypothetical protein